MTALPLAAGAGDATGRRDSWGGIAVLGAMALAVLDAAIANVALPTIGRSLAVTPAMAIRVVTAYQLGVVIMLLPAAALGESIGLRRVFTAGVALFTGASLLCTFAPSLTWLVAARFLQGIGGAAIMAFRSAIMAATGRA